MIKLLVILIIFAFSALSNYLQKRRQAERQREAARNPPPTTPRAGQTRPTTPATPPRSVRPASWEEELRRLLEGETPAAPPPIRPPPPIAAPPNAPRTITLPQLRPAVPAPAPSPVRPAVVRPAVVRMPEASPAPLPVPTVTSLGSRDLASMSQSREAYERARQLAQQTAARIEKVPTQRVQLTTVTRAKASEELSQAVAMFNNSRAARQAVIASLVLGAPRALEPADAGSFAHV